MTLNTTREKNIQKNLFISDHNKDIMQIQNQWQLSHFDQHNSYLQTTFKKLSNP